MKNNALQTTLLVMIALNLTYQTINTALTKSDGKPLIVEVVSRTSSDHDGLGAGHMTTFLIKNREQYEITTLKEDPAFVGTETPKFIRISRDGNSYSPLYVGN